MKKNNIGKLLKKIEGELSLSDKFHVATNNRGLEKNNIKTIPQSWIKIHFKTYPRLDKIHLDEDILSNNFYSLIKKRESIREFSGLAISKKQISNLLFLCCGIIKLGKSIDESRRSYPSAGARYPLEVYPIILNCNGIKKGLYHYNVKDNVLELLLERDFKSWLIEITCNQEWVKNSSVVLIITGVFDRTRIKYGDRGYRYILFEAGHLAQDICLLAGELNLGCCPIGGFIDQKVDKLLDIDKQKECSLYMLVLGKL